MIRPRSGRGWLALAGTSCVLVAGGATAASSLGTTPGEYRIAAATTGSVQEHVDLTGMVSASGRTDLAFSVAGTVARVLVEQGEEVEAGDVIARTSRTDLQRTLDRAQATLDAAEAQLEADLQSQAAAVTSAGSASTTSSPTASCTSRSTAPPTSKSTSETTPCSHARGNPPPAVTPACDTNCGSGWTQW